MARYMGATFSLLMTLASIAMTVFFIAKGHAGGSIAMGIMALAFGAMVVFGDWQRVWKPLFTRKQ